jgi:hypothetical protein
VSSFPIPHMKINLVGSEIVVDQRLDFFKDLETI